jgi:formate hydrogenlyase subunit 3/multisubunit Na+/H+ antiporter MnhD subunit
MTDAWIPALCLLPPLVFAAAVCVPRSRRVGLLLAPWAALPALFVSLFGSGTVQIPWLVLGSEFVIDETAQVFLFLTALLWTTAGVYAAGYYTGKYAGKSGRERFWLFFLLAMTGNIGVSIAYDLAGFYAFFALMTFSSYGLVIHNRNNEAKLAAWVYVVMAIMGEMMLLIGFWLAASGSESLLITELAAHIPESPYAAVIVAMLIAGFGVKAGLFPLHVWLPLAHPAAPLPASAVLSGAMIKAGLLGWVRFLPLGLAPFPEIGTAVIILGLLMTFFGVVVGVAQDEPKTVLAYSSVSQMGFMTMAIGGGLAAPTAWPLALSAVLVFALHHAFAKGTLFLGTGLVAGQPRALRIFALLLLLIASLSLAGAPLTSGAMAKSTFKYALHEWPGDWPLWLDWILPLTGIGTTLVMGRYMVLMIAEGRKPVDGGFSINWLMWLPWLFLWACAFSALWVFPVRYAIEIRGEPRVGLADLFYAAWPVLLGALLVWRVRWLRRHPQGQPYLRPGDFIYPILWLWLFFNRQSSRVSRSVSHLRSRIIGGAEATFGFVNMNLAADRVERVTVSWGYVGFVLCSLIVAFWLLLYLAAGGA